MSITRRAALRGLMVVPLAGHEAVTRQPAQESELIVCGWDEVFIMAVGEGASPAHRRVWSWRAADSPEIAADLRPLFRTTDDCKPIDGGRRILVSSSGGAVAVIDRQTRRASFVARVTNAHSIEMLPGGRIAAAASVSTAGSGNRIVIFDAAGKELISDELRSAHGVVWDERRDLLWALGGDVLRAYAVGAPGGSTTLDRRFEMPLPDRGGHDLVPIPASSRLFLSTERRCFYFDRDRRQLSPHETLGDRPDVKSYNVHQNTGRIVYVQAEGSNWWAEHLHFAQPEGTLRLPGEHLYKARWA